VLTVAALARAQEATPAVPQGTAGLPMPTEYRLNLIIRMTIMALNDANMTGNESVPPLGGLLPPC
jgi:hypothetical protein